jgi:hypothetical protein
MPKKCIICGGEAKYLIKGTSDYYCDECAEENFADLSLLQTVDEKDKQVADTSDDEPDSEFEEDSEDSEQEEE